MDVILKDEIRVARKHYTCDAYRHWNNCGMGQNDCVADDQRLIVQAAEADKGKILPGQEYRYARGVFEGRMVTWRARVGMEDVCKELGLYFERT